MKTLSLAGFVTFIGLLSFPLLTAESPKAAAPVLKERGSISGGDLKAIQSALPVFEAHGLRVDAYRVIVLEEGESIIVLFDDPDRSPGQKGSTGRMVSFEVRLRKSDLTVVGSNFVR